MAYRSGKYGGGNWGSYDSYDSSRITGAPQKTTLKERLAKYTPEQMAEHNRMVAELKANEKSPAQIQKENEQYDRDNPPRNIWGLADDTYLQLGMRHPDSPRDLGDDGYKYSLGEDLRYYAPAIGNPISYIGSLFD